MIRRAAMFLALVVSAPLLSAQPAEVGADYGRLLGKYVTPDGVRYAAWRASAADTAALTAIVGQLSKLDFKSMAPPERHAAFINLYNAKIVETVLTGNPKESIKDLSNGRLGFEIFYRDMLEVEGTKISLTKLEERLREESKDPRVHFAVNCASRSCPPVAAEPYDGARLDAQLESSANAFLARPGSIVVTERGGKIVLAVSKIFDWYAKDFDWAGGAEAFIGAHGPAEVKARVAAPGAKVKLDYQDYDWSLNTAP